MIFLSNNKFSYDSFMDPFVLYTFFTVLIILFLLVTLSSRGWFASTPIVQGADPFQTYGDARPREDNISLVGTDESHSLGIVVWEYPVFTLTWRAELTLVYSDPHAESSAWVTVHGDPGEDPPTNRTMRGTCLRIQDTLRERQWTLYIDAIQVASGTTALSEVCPIVLTRKSGAFSVTVGHQTKHFAVAPRETYHDAPWTLVVGAQSYRQKQDLSVRDVYLTNL